jgi:hypothetical protein
MKSKKIRWEMHIARIVDMTNAREIVVGKHEGKKVLRPSVYRILLRWI